MNVHNHIMKIISHFNRTNFENIFHKYYQIFNYRTCLVKFSGNRITSDVSEKKTNHIKINYNIIY